MTADKVPPEIDFTTTRGGTLELLLLGVLNLDGGELTIATLPTLTTKDGTRCSSGRRPSNRPRRTARSSRPLNARSEPLTVTLERAENGQTLRLLSPRADWRPHALAPRRASRSLIFCSMRSRILRNSSSSRSFGSGWSTLHDSSDTSIEDSRRSGQVPDAENDPDRRLRACSAKNRDSAIGTNDFNRRLTEIGYESKRSAANVAEQWHGLVPYPSGEPLSLTTHDAAGHMPPKKVLSIVTVALP